MKKCSSPFDSYRIIEKRKGAKHIKREERANYVQLDIHGDFLWNSFRIVLLNLRKKRLNFRALYSICIIPSNQFCAGDIRLAHVNIHVAGTYLPT